MNQTSDGQQSRSLATQHALMDAAETLISEKGIHNVSIKEIVKNAGQKNESALQYHFGNLRGLINAIHARRAEQTKAKRSEMLDELIASGHSPELRDLCRIMVMPNFLLARASVGYSQYIAAFAHEIAVTNDSALVTVARMGGGGESGARLGHLLRAALPHLDEKTYRQRMDIAIRTGSTLIGHHARQKGAYHGKSAEFFISTLIDAIEGLLSAPISQATRAIYERGD